MVNGRRVPIPRKCLIYSPYKENRLPARVMVISDSYSCRARCLMKESQPLASRESHPPAASARRAGCLKTSRLAAAFRRARRHRDSVRSCRSEGLLTPVCARLEYRLAVAAQRAARRSKARWGWLAGTCEPGRLGARTGARPGAQIVPVSESRKYGPRANCASSGDTATRLCPRVPNPRSHARFARSRPRLPGAQELAHAPSRGR
jgi:hypothetical protein